MRLSCGAVFTGLIEDLGTVFSIDRAAEQADLVVQTRLAPEIAVGQSVAIDGVCLTVVERAARTLRFTAVAETLDRTTLGGWTAGQRCNVERALTISDRLGGHIVQGHVDGVGRIERRVARADSVDVTFGASADVLRYVVPKGSIAVDGVSLTVTTVDARGFGVALIPHTLSLTTLGEKREGARVNLETDVLARYVEKLTASRTTASSAITMEFLREHGFA
jgi:riboflavin synthase